MRCEAARRLKIENKRQNQDAGKKRVRNGGMKMSGIMICVTGVVVIVAASLAAGSVLYLIQRKKKKLKSEQINL